MSSFKFLIRATVPVWFALTLLSSPTSAFAEPENLLAGDSGSWTKAWKAGYGCSISTAPDGNGKVLVQSLPVDFSKGNHSWQQRVPIEPGQPYSFHVLYELRDVGEALVQFHFADSDGKLMDYVKFRLSTAPLSGTEYVWQDLDFDWTAPPEAASVLVALRLNSPGIVYWKDPVLTKGN